MAKLTAHITNSTWKIVQVPAERKLITCKWVYKIKYNPDKTIDKYKARLIARDFT